MAQNFEPQVRGMETKISILAAMIATAIFIVRFGRKRKIGDTVDHRVRSSTILAAAMRRL